MRVPYIPIKIWNMFDAVMQGSPKTKNAVEGYFHMNTIFNGDIVSLNL